MKCVCLKFRPDGVKPCACPVPIQKCLVLGCYHPGTMPYPPDPSFGKFCMPHGEMHNEIEASKEKCNAEIKRIEACSEYMMVESRMFLVEQTGEIGMNSGRARYKVTCCTCNEVVHEATTGPQPMARNHVVRCGHVG